MASSLPHLPELQDHLVIEECLDNHPDAETPCKGPVLMRTSLSGSGMSFPRCDAHWEIRLEKQEEIRQAFPDSPIAPSWFDPMDAGESWDEDPGLCEDPANF
jgi:hypothetical protein